MNIPLSVSTEMGLREIFTVLKFIDKHPSNQGKLAKKACTKILVIILLIIFLVMFPLCMFTFQYFNSSHLPDGASKEVRGHISKYENTFWYTDSSTKYEFDLDEYTEAQKYEKGAIIKIYLDDENNIVGFSDGKDIDKTNIRNFAIMYLVPIILLLMHAFIGRKTYCKDWFLYLNWYRKEIAPYIYKDNFEEIVQNKEYYNIYSDVKDLSVEDRKKYRILMFKLAIVDISIILYIIIAIYIFIKYNTNRVIFAIVTISYILLVYFLSKKYETKINEIRSVKN